MKKTILFVLSFLCAICMLCGAVGCNNTPEPTNNVTLDKTEAVVRVGETILLTPSSDDKTSEFIWGTDNASVVSVNKYGNVTGVSEGTAVVTVKQGNGSATCSVEVVETNDYPTLSLGRDMLELSLTDPVTLSPVLRYKGNATSCTFEYKIADESIATVTAGGVVSGKKVGNTSLTVRTSFRGIILEEVLSVSVKEVDTSFTVSTNEVTIYTYSAGGAFEVSETVTAKVTVSGVEEQNPEITWSVDENGADIAEVNNGVITAKKAGKTTVYASWTSVNGIEYKHRISVNVLPATLDFNGVLDLIYDKEDNDISAFTEAYADFFEDKIISVVIKTAEGDEPVAFSQNGTKLAVTDEELTVGDYTMVFSTDKIALKAQVAYCTRIISTVEEMLNIQTYGNGTEDYTGYFVLANNIDFEGGESNPEIKSTYSYGGEKGGFHGVFDGRGYTIKNVRIATFGGLFGGVNADGTIRNVAFENIDIVNTDGSPMGGVFGKEFCGKMENVFISATLNGTPHSGAIANFVTGCEIKNSVFVVGGTLSDSLSGALANHISWSSFHPVFDNCYVITELGKLWHTITDNPDGTQTIKITQGTSSVAASNLDESIWDMSGSYPTFITGTKAVALEDREYEQYTGILNGTRVANTANLTIEQAGALYATFNGKRYEAANNAAVIPAADLVAAAAKEYTVTLSTAFNVYTFKLSLYTKKISTVKEMLDIQTYGNGTADFTGYFILANDIDFNGAANNPEIKTAWSYGAAEGGFHGVFDGRFHKIKNVKIKTYGGLFGGVNANGTVKNVAFEDIDITYQDGVPMGGVMGIEFCGKMENVFISATLNGSPHSGAIANYVTACEIKNSVFVVKGTIADDLSGALANHTSWSSFHPVFDNCYVITELDKLWNTITDNPDGTQTIKITQGTTSVEATGLDENIWDLSGNYPVYKN